MIWPLILALAAPEPTGLDLLRMCNGEPGTEAHAGCTLYLTGFLDGLRVAQDAKRQLKRPLACPPPLVTGEDLRAAYRSGVKDSARRQRAPMNAALSGVVAEAYPCR